MQPGSARSQPPEFDITPVPDYFSLLRLDDRGFVVFGAGQGIGRQSAHALAQAGARVACVDNYAPRAEKVAAEVNGVALTADVTRREDVQRVLDQAQAAVGPVSGLVDVVGLVLGGPLAAVQDDRYQQQFDIVLKHAFLAMQLGGQTIASAGGGAMVFVGSIAGVGYTAQTPIYGAAKAALHDMVRTASHELAASGVRVNAVAPGSVMTPRIVANSTPERLAAMGQDIPRGTAAMPSEIASIILFLCSDMAINVTGRTILADGGAFGRNWPKNWPNLTPR